jgi:hypothetical protein
VDWIEDWAVGKIQRVCIQGEKSESCPVDSDIPQGKFLGPVLFTVHIHNLEIELDKLELEVKLVKFIDDTKGGKVIGNTEDRDKLQRALDYLCDWAEK